MEFKDVIYGRTSVRIFEDYKLTEEEMLKLVDYAQHAPSACNQQLWRFIWVKDDAVKKRLVEEAGASKWLLNQPNLLYVVYEKNLLTTEEANKYSAACAIENLLLGTYDMGYGSTWIDYFGKEEKVREILAMPKVYNVIAAIIIGKPKIKLPKPPRVDPKRLLFENSIGKKASSLRPGSIDVTEWPLQVLKEFRDNSLRQTSPAEEAFPFGVKKEFDSEMKIISSWLSKKNSYTEFLAYAGTHCVRLAKQLKIKTTVVEYSKNSKDFILGMVRLMQTPKDFTFHIEEGEKFAIEDNSFETVACFQKLEEIPNPQTVLSEMCRTVKKDGELILSFRNYQSFYGLYYFVRVKLLKYIKGMFYPIKPIKLASVEQTLQKNGLKIEEIKGISLLPFNRGSIVQNPTLARYSKIVLIRARKI